ncbi:universal stress protein [Arachnia propionica]|uniref:Universal stress protein n=1 Tax=Arachnia propionica TaxID=1750 RepID=A0A3P1TBT0_9ACTN|nr:universal stress protein [Arachnia propionica]MDO5084527.1 universal stress protein [Arachnia propionica]RRD06336.1 universal stress protein [Arachnia propionica]RRD48553.1 universal stress protein [Arachnia propionica]
MLKDYTTIVVGTDGSELAGPTVTRAAWIAVKEEAELVIVCAYGGGSRRGDAKINLGDTTASRLGQVPGKEAATRAVQHAQDIARAAGATVRAALLVEADPADALLETSKERLGDLIVIGAIRDRSITGRLLGDVAREVVSRAHCDVLMVRPFGDVPQGDQHRPESDG